jgi:hypothetical protein
MSEDLVERLVKDLRPVSPGVVVRRLGLGIVAGAVVSALLTVVLLGARPDMGQAVGAPMFWMKFAYTALIAVLALWACERLARPVGAAQGRIPWLLAPLMAMAVLAVWRLTQTAPDARAAMVMGHSAGLCPWFIFALSLPPLAGLIWAMRGLAATRLRLAGILVGLAAGGAGATAYALHCDEMAAPFLATWYTLGVLSVGALGGILGPRVLRW